MDKLIDLFDVERNLRDATYSLNATGDEFLDKVRMGNYTATLRENMRQYFQMRINSANTTHERKNPYYCRKNNSPQTREIKREFTKLCAEIGFRSVAAVRGVADDINRRAIPVHTPAHNTPNKLFTQAITQPEDFYRIRTFLLTAQDITLAYKSGSTRHPAFWFLTNVRTMWSSDTWKPVPYGYVFGGMRMINRMSEWDAMQTLHNLHISTEDPTQVAYYPTLSHMVHGREVRTKLGRYLAKYCGTDTVFDLSESDIKVAADKFVAFTRGDMGWTVKFIEGDDARGWVTVYEQGPSSCMQGEECVKVYAHDKSVLRLAYLSDQSDNIIARCIVREDDQKGWLRVYPEPESRVEARFLLDSLVAMGYDKRINLDGVLLRALEGSRYSGGYVCPYLDYGSGGSQTVSVVTLGGREYLECGGGDFEAANTNGYTSGGGRECDCCGDRVSDEDSTYIESTDSTVCEHCRDNEYTYAYGRSYQDYFPNEDCVYCRSDGEYYVQDYASQHDVFECENGDWYHIDDLTSFEGDFYHNDDMIRIDHPYYDRDRGEDVEYIPRHLRCTLSDNTTCHEDDEERHEAEIEAASGQLSECDQYKI